MERADKAEQEAGVQASSPLNNQETMAAVRDWSIELGTHLKMFTAGACGSATLSGPGAKIAVRIPLVHLGVNTEKKLVIKLVEILSEAEIVARYSSTRSGFDNTRKNAATELDSPFITQIVLKCGRLASTVSWTWDGAEYAEFQAKRAYPDFRSLAWTEVLRVLVKAPTTLGTNKK